MRLERHSIDDRTCKVKVETMNSGNNRWIKYIPHRHVLHFTAVNTDTALLPFLCFALFMFAHELHGNKKTRHLCNNNLLFSISRSLFNHIKLPLPAVLWVEWPKSILYYFYALIYLFIRFIHEEKNVCESRATDRVKVTHERNRNRNWGKFLFNQ